jgi:hypothetical protein
MEGRGASSSTLRSAPNEPGSTGDRADPGHDSMTHSGSRHPILYSVNESCRPTEIHGTMRRNFLEIVPCGTRLVKLTHW